jgi:hypothetical protein
MDWPLVDKHGWLELKSTTTCGSQKAYGYQVGG